MMDRDRELHEMADEGRALMNDYIKKEDAYSACCYETPECYMARKDIKALPSADVVEVVRCKDCKHCEYAWNRIPTEQAWVCYKLGIDVEQDWFCADGERKDNE